MRVTQQTVNLSTVQTNTTQIKPEIHSSSQKVTQHLVFQITQHRKRNHSGGITTTTSVHSNPMSNQLQLPLPQWRLRRGKGNSSSLQIVQAQLLTRQSALRSIHINTYGGGIQCQGPTLNFSIITGAGSFPKPYQDY